jgi:hypothetical protein
VPPQRGLGLDRDANETDAGGAAPAIVNEDTPDAPSRQITVERSRTPTHPAGDDGVDEDDDRFPMLVRTLSL